MRKYRKSSFTFVEDFVAKDMAMISEIQSMISCMNGFDLVLGFKETKLLYYQRIGFSTYFELKTSEEMKMLNKRIV